MTQKEFLSLVFKFDSEQNKPKMKTLWLDDITQQALTTVLGHKYPKLRIRYWQRNKQTVWFLDKIGKERPISFAISIKHDEIQRINVLTFRESRGYEIHMQAFTEQFNQLGLDENNQLNQSVDGITGATMSVSAMKKVARAALVLARLVTQ